MDQGSLVVDQISAAAAFLSEIEKSLPVKIASWVKAFDEGKWTLFVASDKINQENVREAYGEVLRLAREMPELGIDPFDVKLAGGDDPVATALLEIRGRYPATRLRTHYRGLALAAVGIEEAIIYGPTTALASP